MDLHAWCETFRLIWSELCARTCNDHNPLFRFARSPGGITGNRLHGWEPNR